MVMLIIPLIIYLPKIDWKYTFIVFLLEIIILSVYDITPIISNIFINNTVLSDKVVAYTSLEGNVLNIKGGNWLSNTNYTFNVYK